MFNYDLTAFGRFLKREGIHIENVGHMTSTELLHQIGYTIEGDGRKIFRDNGTFTGYRLDYKDFLREVN